MKTWFDIALPHEDIRKGGFDEAVFAADLGDVALGTAALDYNDPYTFFKKTYLTQGLRTLLSDVQARLAHGTGAGVVELQTPFGGGKTHSLVTIYHYLRNGKKVEELLPEGLGLIDEPALSVIVGTQLNASEGRTENGVTRRTLWGEVAYQVGGATAFNSVRKNDENRVSPGKEAIRALLDEHQPFVLLFDEILEYVVKARGVKVEEGSLAAQTLLFFKELTEAVASIDRGLMVVTLPSSDLEDFGDQEQHNLLQLEKVFGRLESISTPVADEEIHSIIRRRLFEPVKDESAVRKIVDAYFQKYQEHKEELPGKAREAGFREQMERSYPFHPDVVNILYEKWGTFPSFQRTRGVLRLLANVIEDLFQTEKNLDLILPGDINLARSEVRREFLKHIGAEYDGIITSDIAGGDAKSQVMDRANPGWKHLAERSATAVFLHSFTAGESESGAKLADIKLAVLRPDTMAPLVTEIVQTQGDELWYLNKRGDRHYFSNVPNLNRMVLDKKAVISKADARAALERRVERELGSKLRCYKWPRDAADLPDNRELKLAVLDPAHLPAFSDLKSWVDRRGDQFRAYKNTLFFAWPDENRFDKLLDSVKELMALREIEAEMGESTTPGIGERRADVTRRIKDLEDELPEMVRDAYRTVVVPRASGELEKIHLGQPSVGKEKLDTWYWNELTDSSHQKILDVPPSAKMLAVKFLGDGQPRSLAVVLEQFYKDPGLPVPADSSVIASAISRAVEEGALGLGAGSPEEIRPSSVKYDEPVATFEVEFHEDVFLLPQALARRLKEEATEEPAPTGEGEGTEGGAGPDEPGPKPGPAPGPAERVKRLAFRASGIPVQKLADLHRGVLMPLSREVGNFEFTLEIDVTGDEGISKKVIETQVMETLRQLKATVANLGSDE